MDCSLPLSMGFSRQEDCSGLLCPSPGDLPDLGLEPRSLMSPALTGRFSTTRENPLSRFCPFSEILLHRYHIHSIHPILVIGQFQRGFVINQLFGVKQIKISPGYLLGL